MKYLLSSSYFHAPGVKWAGWFFHVWWANVLAADPRPEKVVIIAQAGCKVPSLKWNWRGRKIMPEVINLTGDIGWCDHLLKGEKKVVMPACCASWLACAWLAYMNETDLVVLEQDCFAVGPWVERLYKDLGDKQAIFGESKMQGTASSLFLIRHAFIPTFVADYLAEGPQTHLQRISETCLHRIIERKPEQYTRFKFGCGKDKPMDIGDVKDKYNVRYFEKLTPAELLILEQQGWLSLKGMPKVEIFSNHQ